MKNLLLISFLFLCACREGWTDAYKSEYLESCREGNRNRAADEQALEKYCSCALEHTMQHYKTIEEVVENADSTQLSAEINQCRVTVSGKKQP
jgi:hypothetical protein